jgi:mono/diheme cytochrome c family protein
VVRALTALLVLSACSGGDRDLPAAYRRLAVPTAQLDSAAAGERGRALFLAHCALCHGERGDGHGVRREDLTVAPRDFTDAEWQRKTTPRRIYYTILEGVHGTPMPHWSIFTPREVWDLVAYVRSLGGPR